MLAQLATTRGSRAKAELVAQTLKSATALEAKYFAKMLSGDLRIGLKESAVEDALARLFQTELARVQRANMLSGDLGQVAVLARHARLDEAVFELFHPLKFMLATPAKDNDDIEKTMPLPFRVEDKFDGIRAQAHIAPHRAHDEALHGENYGDVRVALFSRALNEITGAFPDLGAPLAALLGNEVGLVLDGEIVPLDENGALAPFQSLQTRLNRKKPSAEIIEQTPLAFVAYDVLFAGANELELPLNQRRAILEKLDFAGTKTRLAASQLFDNVTDLDAEFEAARARGNEGLMIKDSTSIYQPGKRGRQWLKVKKATDTLDVVVTSVESGSGRRSKFYSDYTFAVRASADDATLLNVGKAYSGLTDAEILELSDWFVAHTIQTFAHGRVRTVEPQIVLEITFDKVQLSPRHKSGYALRFPRILRRRDDKPVEEIDTLDAVKKLAG